MEKKLTICALTWNLLGETPSIDSIELLIKKYKDLKYDMFVIGTQECLRSIIFSLIYWDKTYWEQLFINYINTKNTQEYYIAASGTLSAMHIMVIAKKELKSSISNVGYSFIKTGGYNFLGNKGAIYVWFNYNNIPITFINCHLAAFRECQSKRNKNFKTIINNFEVTNAKKVFNNNKYSEKENLNVVKGKNILNKFWFILIMGDYNSRNDNTLINMLKLIKTNQLEEMLRFDQLNQAIQKRDIDMNGLIESKIKFYPTFKFVPGSLSKYIADCDENMPAFTDRIFYKVKENTNLKIEIYNYTSNSQVTISDHKPVILDFALIF